jgi:hypothetical protein
MDDSQATKDGAWSNLCDDLINWMRRHSEFASWGAVVIGHDLGASAFAVDQFGEEVVATSDFLSQAGATCQLVDAVNDELVINPIPSNESAEDLATRKMATEILDDFWRWDLGDSPDQLAFYLWDAIVRMTERAQWEDDVQDELERVHEIQVRFRTLIKAMTILNESHPWVTSNLKNLRD